MQKRIRYKGHVQGVGFRYSVRQIVSGYEISGTVQNQSDGSVLLEVEGEERELQLFLTELKNEMAGFIREVEEEILLPESPKMSGFRILHS